MKNKIIFISLFAITMVAPSPVQAQSLKDIFKSAKKEVDKLSETDKKEKTNSKNKKSSDKSESKIQDFNFEKGLILKGPNDNFKSIDLQLHDGLPRIGAVNSYGKYTTRDHSYNEDLGNKIKSYIEAQKFYFTMTYIKYKSEQFRSMERNFLYGRITDKDLDERLRKQFQLGLQKEIESDCRYMLDESGINKYFVNPKAGYGGKAVTWGGRDADEFRKQEIYTKYIEENLDDFLDWSQKDFFNNDMLEFYYVEPVSLKSYNFEMGAYELSYSASQLKNISIPMFNPDKRKNEFTNYVEQNEFEYNQIDDVYSQYGLYMPMDSKKAKSLKDELSGYSVVTSVNSKVLYLVRKMKIKTVPKRRTLKSKNSEYQPQEFSFSFSEPFIEVYADEALTDKIGQIQVFKTN